MTHYDSDFASVYDRYWSDFAVTVAPRLLRFYRQTEISQSMPLVLDLCCGTGQLAHYFASEGLRVIGLDRSLSMLDHAREHTHTFAERVTLIEGDASAFTLPEQVGLTVSTYNSLNHMEDEAALRACFQSVYDATLDSGWFIFDLKTRHGLMNWNNVFTQDTGDTFIVMKGRYDGLTDRARNKIVTFIRQPDGNYSRVDEVLINTVFTMSRVRELLLEVGWRDPYFARVSDLATPIDEPEKESRAFIVTQK